MRFPRRLLKIAGITIVILAVLMVAAAIYVQKGLAGFLQNYVRSKYGLSLKIGSAELRFHPLSVRFESIELSSPSSGPFFTAGSASAALPYSSFWSEDFVVHEVVVHSPRIDLNRRLDLSFAETGSSASAGGFRIDRLAISSAAVMVGDHEIHDIFVDASVGPAAVELRTLRARLENMEMSAKGTVSIEGVRHVSIEYEAHGDAGDLRRVLPESISLTGPFDVRGNVAGTTSQPVITGGLSGETFSLGGQGPFSVSARYKYDFANKNAPIHVEVDWRSLPLSTVRHYVPAVPETSSACSGTLRYSGSQNLWNGEGTADVQIVPAGRVMPVGGSFRVALAQQSLRIEGGSIRIRSTNATFSGTLQQSAMTVRAELDTRSAADFAFLEPKLASIPGTYQARMEISGPYRDLRIQGRILGRSAHAELEAEGSYLPARGSALVQFRGTATAADVRPFVPQLKEGELEISGSFNGKWPGAEWKVRASGSNLCAGDFAIGKATVDIQGRGPRAEFRTDAPDLQISTEGTYHVNTGVYEIRGRLEPLSVSEFAAASGKTLPAVEGLFAADFEASGDLDRWKQSKIIVRVEDTDLRFEDLVVRMSEMQISTDQGELAVQFIAQGPNTTLSALGSIALTRNYEMDLHTRGTVGAGVLERITEDWIGEGEVYIDTRIRGTPSSPQVEGSVDTRNLSLCYVPRDLHIAVNRLGLSFSPKGLDLDGAGRLNDSPVSWTGFIPAEQLPGSIHLEVLDLPLRTVINDPRVSGILQARVDLRGEGAPVELAMRRLPFRDWTGEIQVTPSDLKLGDKELSMEALNLLYQEQKIQLSPVRITSGEMLDLYAGGSANLESGELDASVKMEARIELLSDLRADIQSSGPLTAEMRVQGTLEKPQYNGRIELTGASIRIPNSPVSLEDLTLSASLDENRLTLEKFQARSGGGTITGDGEILKGTREGRLSFRGSNVAMLYPEGLRSQIDFDLNLTREQPNFLLSGNITVLRSFYEQQINLRNPIVRDLMATRQQLGAEKQLRNRIRLALNIRTGRDMLLRNSLADLRAAADIKVEGSLYRPVLAGAVVVRPGSRLFMLGNEFDVEKARFNFYRRESLAPDLDVSLTSLIRDSSTDTFYEIHLPFSGSFSDIEFHNVRSSPSLSEDQVFSLISLGTISPGPTGSQRDMLQGRILAFLAGQALGSPTSVLARSLGLSRIQVQQEGLNSVNDPKTRLVLGKDIGAGFGLVYSFALNEPEDQTWIATYRYGRNIMARFIDQSDGTVTTSISHRVQFGKGTRLDATASEVRRRDADPRISTVAISNNSVIPDEKVREVLRVSEGNRFDYWEFHDRAQKILRELQQLGFLAPVADVREAVDGQNVSLSIEIRSGPPGDMIFRGVDVGKKEMEYYLGLWRQGISPVIAQEIIRQDILQKLRTQGRHRASVSTYVCESDLIRPPCPARNSPDGVSRVDYVFDATPGALFTSVDLQFHGAGHYAPAVLQKDLHSQYGSATRMILEALHDSDSFVERVQALYQEHGYLRAVVSAGPVEYVAGEGRISRVMRIEEGPASRVAKVTTAQGTALPEALLSRLVLRPPQVFSPDGIVDDELALRNYFESAGHQDVRVAGRLEFEKDTPDIRVVWEVKMGPVARIAGVRITGNESTSTEVIRNVARFREGEILTQHSRSMAHKRLSDLGIFQQVTIVPEETGEPGQYVVAVQVVESKRYELQYGGRYNTDDKLGGELRLTDFNFLGRAHNLGIYLRYSLDLPIYRLDYTLPVMGSIWDRTRFSFFHDVRDENLTATVSGEDLEVPFEFTETAFQFQQDYRLNPSYQLIWGFDFAGDTARFTDFDTRLPVQFTGSVARLRSALIAERRDDPLNARHGHFFSIEGEFAPSVLGTDISYQKFFSQFFYYRSVGPFTYAGGARIGFLNIRRNILTVGEKFRAGGSATVRGFGHNQLVPGDDPISIFFGGNSVFIINQELRFPIYKWITGAAFYDGGNVYMLVSDFDPLDLRHTAGFGIRGGAAGLVLRLDLGFNLDPQEFESRHVFHFGIGQAF